MKQILLILLSLFTTLSATIINVPADQATIQAGIDIAAEGDTVLVQPGTYYENLYWPATNGINLIGSGPEDCIINGDSLGSVIRMSYNDVIPTLIDSFTIQNGYANGDDLYSSGGGIFCLHTSLYLSNLIIISNTATEEGGGIFCWDSDLNLFDISILNNRSNIEEWNTGGGGVNSRNSTLEIENVNFEDNLTLGSGGGLFSLGSTVNILNSEFSNNQSLYDAGGNNQFGGGGLFCYGGTSNIENVTFSNNSTI